MENDSLVMAYVEMVILPMARPYYMVYSQPLLKILPVQSDSLSAPVVIVFKEFGQSVHDVLPTASEYVFTAHSVHTPSFSY